MKPSSKLESIEECLLMSVLPCFLSQWEELTPPRPEPGEPAEPSDEGYE